MSVDTTPAGPPRMVFAGILVSLSVTAISQTFVTTALPTMVGDLGGFDGLSWVVGGYLLASTVVVPFAGKLADLYGTHRLFQMAIIVFAIGSIIAGRSTTVEVLVAARVLQGLGGGAILTLSFTLVAQLVVPRASVVATRGTSRRCSPSPTSPGRCSEGSSSTICRGGGSST